MAISLQITKAIRNLNVYRYYYSLIMNNVYILKSNSVICLKNHTKIANTFNALNNLRA